MKKLLLFAIMIMAGATFAQKIKIVEGSLDALKGATVIQTQFGYSNMVIGKDGLSEAEYIVKKKGEYNAKEAGRGDKWEISWKEDRANRFEPKFNELFEKTGSLSTKGASKYTLIFNTTRTEPGWNVGIMRQSAKIDAEVLVVETANPSTIIAKLTVMNAPGQDAMGYDFDSGLRIQEAYAKSGKELGKMIAKL